MSDYDPGGEARSMIRLRLVREQSDLSDEEAERVERLWRTRRRVRESTGLHGFTSLINQHWSEHHRLDLVEQMWRVVAARWTPG